MYIYIYIYCIHIIVYNIYEQVPGGGQALRQASKRGTKTRLDAEPCCAKKDVERYVCREMYSI